MTNDDIIRMAQEANRYANNQTGDRFEWQLIRDERFAALVAAAEREALRADIDALRADAERYRWLRSNALAMDAVADPDNLVSVWHGTDPAMKSEGRTLDAAIDAAIAKAEGQQCA